mmetsp:Transcript_24059/g.42996  ORF Transcript_24059/g.42996 Transcript_24059/m.42996 type:complete len:92 (+) Transcript_24059:66-341(+)
MLLMFLMFLPNDISLLLFTHPSTHSLDSPPNLLSLPSSTFSLLATIGPHIFALIRVVLPVGDLQRRISSLAQSELLPALRGEASYIRHGLE